MISFFPSLKPDGPINDLGRLVSQFGDNCGAFRFRLFGVTATMKGGLRVTLQY
jgi:hypothetical protein